MGWIAASILAAATFGTVTVTNHAGHAVSGELQRVSKETFTLSGRELPLSILPESERQRLKKLVGQDVRSPRERRIEADLELELRRIDARLQEGEISAAQADELRKTARESARHRLAKPVAAPET